MLPATGIGILDWLLGLLDAWGYGIVFAATIVENLFIVGSFMPGETVVATASFISSLGALKTWGVWVASFLGTIAGSNLSYLFGRHGGRTAIEKWATRLLGEERAMRRIRDAEEYFEAHGSKTVLFARFAAVFKNFVPMMAGASKMRIAVFQLYTVIGAAVYTTMMVVLGFFLGENFDLVASLMRNVTWAGFLLFAVMVAIIVISSRGYGRRFAKFGDEPEDCGDPDDDD